MRKCDGFLINFAERVLLLLILPPTLSHVARSALHELNVVTPQFAGIWVTAYLLNCDFERLLKNASVGACGVGGKRMTTSEVIEVEKPQFHVRHIEERVIEDLFKTREVVFGELHLSIFEPEGGLANYVSISLCV